MKRQLIFVMTGLMICVFFAAGATASIEIIKSKIAAVTVYPGSAMITRSGAVNLQAGEHSVVFENIPFQADIFSFQVSTAGLDGVTILGLKHSEVNHLESQQKREAELENRVKELEEVEIKEIEDHIGILEDEKNFLLAIGKSGTDEMTRQIAAGTVDPIKWEAAMGFFGKKLRLISDSLRYFENKKADDEEKLELLKKELLGIGRGRGSNYPTRTVQIDLVLKKAGDMKVSLDYMVLGAAWAPLYDARFDVKEKKVKLNYFAELKQHTGEDWDSVNLMVSTARPSQYAGPGDIKSIQADIQEMDIDSLFLAAAMDTNNQVIIRGGSFGEVAYIVDGEAITGVGLLSSSIPARIGFDISYIISRKETILTGGESVRCPIAQWEFDAETNYICRPRNVAAVFRQAAMTNRNDGILMPGPVNIFAESSYLGKDSLKEIIYSGQEFELLIGLDNNISAKRDIVSRKKSVYSNQEEIAETIKITLKNHSGDQRTVSLEEAVPVSRNNQVKVKDTNFEPRPNSIDEQGLAKWEIAMSPDEEKVVTFSYRVSYPRGKKVKGL